MISGRNEGVPFAGIPVGILVLDTRHELAPGNVQNASTFPFPVLYHVVRGVSVPALLTGDAAALPAVVDGVQALERQGVSIIVGACGSFAYYQRAAASSVGVPVCLSIMCAVPLLLATLPPSRRLGVLMASKSALRQRVLDECGIADASRLVVIEAMAVDSFHDILNPDRDIDHLRLARELAELVTRTMNTHGDIAAWLIQCSDLPPYAHAIQAAAKVPVFDMTTLIGFLAAAAKRRPFG